MASWDGMTFNQAVLSRRENKEEDFRRPAGRAYLPRNMDEKDDWKEEKKVGERGNSDPADVLSLISSMLAADPIKTPTPTIFAFGLWCSAFPNPEILISSRQLSLSTRFVESSVCARYFTPVFHAVHRAFRLMNSYGLLLWRPPIQRFPALKQARVHVLIQAVIGTYQNYYAIGTNFVDMNGCAIPFVPILNLNIPLAILPRKVQYALLSSCHVTFHVTVAAGSLATPPYPESFRRMRREPPRMFRFRYSQQPTKSVRSHTFRESKPSTHPGRLGRLGSLHIAAPLSTSDFRTPGLQAATPRGC